MRRAAIPVLALATMIAGTAIADADHHDAPAVEEAVDLQAHVEGASRLEGRIRAPCCLHATGQTLDIHGSEISYALRREIRKRLKGGETPDAIEASIVGRYGPEILAVPPKSPLSKVAVGLAVVMAGAGAFALSLLLRWRRRGVAAAAGRGSSKEPAARDALDDRLDAELSKLE